jgi:hypothetical protein
MNTEQDVCVRELQAILACGQSDGYLKARAKYWIEAIEFQAKLSADLQKVPVLVA